MKIDVMNRGDGTFVLSLDGEDFSLNGQDLKTLLLQLTQVLAPSSDIAREANLKNRRFLERLKTADDVDLQTFIQAADHDDVVILLKAAEDETDICDKLFSNMSDNLRKMFLEDVEFRFKEDVAPSRSHRRWTA